MLPVLLPTFLAELAADREVPPVAQRQVLGRLPERELRGDADFGRVRRSLKTRNLRLSGICLKNKTRQKNLPRNFVAIWVWEVNL